MYITEKGEPFVPYVRPAGEETDRFGKIIKKRTIGFAAEWSGETESETGETGQAYGKLEEEK